MTHASLFSGIGGPEIAASILGWDNLFNCEINEFCRKILNYWFPESKSYEDITKTDFSEWRGKVDVLTGGFPCQPFSYAGKRRGADDDRYLWPYMFKAIDAIRPAWIVAENVAGITTMVEQGEVSELGGQASMFEEVDDIHRYRLEETFTLQRICDDLESQGYTVQPVLVPACAVGAPHRRDRVFIVANRNGLYTSDTDSRGRRKVDEYLEPKLTNGQKPLGNGRKWNASDTDCSLLQRWDCKRSSDSKPRCRTKSFYSKKIQGRWDSFPTVSPVHRGNDGLPFDVDRLAIPFSKWRTESLKAYGNAIVPQVMYEIFRFIEIVEKGGGDEAR